MTIKQLEELLKTKQHEIKLIEEDIKNKKKEECFANAVYSLGDVLIEKNGKLVVIVELDCSSDYKTIYYETAAVKEISGRLNPVLIYNSYTAEDKMNEEFIGVFGNAEFGEKEEIEVPYYCRFFELKSLNVKW